MTARKIGFYQLPLLNMSKQEITQENAKMMHRRTWKNKWDDRTRMRVIFLQSQSCWVIFLTQLIEA
jgi:hypothetical protein